MKEEPILFNIAKLAKEKGFDWCVSQFYGADQKIRSFAQGSLINFNGFKSSYNKSATSAPTHYILATWLRNVHNIIVTSQPNCLTEFANKENLKYYPVFYTYSETKGRFILYTDFIMSDECTAEMQETMPIFQNYDSYEEAFEIGLHEALKLIKDKNNVNLTKEL